MHDDYEKTEQETTRNRNNTRYGFCFEGAFLLKPALSFDSFSRVDFFGLC